MEAPANRLFSEILQEVQAEAGRRQLTLRDLLDLVGPKGHAALTLILVLPFLQPIPLPGLSTPIGLAIATAGLSFALGKPPWIPRRCRNILLSSSAILTVCERLGRLLAVLDRWLKPKGPAFSLKWLQIVLGSLIFFLALLLALPLPIPTSNTFPAAALFLIAYAILEESTIALVAASIAIIANLVFFSILIAVPMFGIRWLEAYS